MKHAFLIPAYNPGKLLPQVLEGLRCAMVEAGLQDVPIILVDDGSTDETRHLEDPSLSIIRLPQNRGKGAALQVGLIFSKDRNIEQVVTLDADAQHPPKEAVRLLLHPAPAQNLLLGVRDMSGTGAPRASQLSNRFSNFMLSLMGGEKLLDTQCGLRRYPVRETLALGAKHPGYAYESEVVLRAARKGLPITHEKTAVFYPSSKERVSYFHSVRDPAQIVVQIVLATLTISHVRPGRRWARRALIATLVLVGGSFLW